MRHDSQHSNAEVVVIDDPWAKLDQKQPSDSSKGQIAARRDFRRLGSWFAPTILTISVHAIFLTPLLLGGSHRHRQTPSIEGAAASPHSQNASEFSAVLMLFNYHSISVDPNQDDIISTMLQKVTNPDQHIPNLIFTTTPTVEINRDEKDTANISELEANGDQVGQAMMFGRYMGQIKARIERAWDYPSGLASTSFRCEVQIKQDRQGEVKEVAILQCDNNVAWQLSLVHAIQSASPLSAPPNDSVFSELVVLSFDIQHDAITVAGNQ